MKEKLLTDSRVEETASISSPNEIIEEIPQSELSAETVVKGREAVKNIIHGRDNRLLVVVGPCSIHDVKAAQEYAQWIKDQRKKYGDNLEIVMRTYLEKPRTTVGWKGIINDPHLDDSFDMELGLRKARKLLVDITELGVPVSTELLDLRTPQYIADLISWGAIGARTVESQLHRELASGVSFPVGFKNGTAGGIQIAIDAMQSAATKHSFLGIDMEGRTATIKTKGNTDTHIILRGSKHGPNYEANSVKETSELLEKAGQNSAIMIDCSHANSRKDFTRQSEVANDVAKQVTKGNKDICGVMVESNLVEGAQKLKPGKELVYGQSITDACVGLDATARILDDLAAAASKR
ncbi:3-deoxy-7-phosphoheptulonate synthase [Candidatus Saccharibacteria bacterium]|nr:3-deoxy-7-phosphoheptulonate synthase [Candidatus Saccharibacteria bacterium]